MVKIFDLIIIFFLLFSNGYSEEFNKDKFLYRVKTIYNTLRTQGLDNYSCWVTSDLFLEKTGKIYNQELYPLELIWKTPNQLYYIKRPIPVLEDTLQNRKTEEWQMDILQALKGIMIDWQRFYAGSILDEIPENFLITTKDDSVYLTYEDYNNVKVVKVFMHFGLNGICLRTKVSYPEIQEEIYTYPAYRLEGDKWLCTGWTVQSLNKGEISSGFSVKLKTKKVDNYWLLERIELQLQQKAEKEIIYTRDYIFKNIILNRDLKIIR
jgi:hypothetical protein